MLESSLSPSEKYARRSEPPPSEKYARRPPVDIKATWEFIRSQPPRKNKKTPAEQEASIDKYFAIVGPSEGFDSVSDSDSDSDMMGDIRPCPVNEKSVKEATDFAFEEYNKNKSDGSRLILEKVVKANHQGVAGVMLYITLQARNEVDPSSSSFYEIKVHLGVKDYKALELFRPAIHYQG